MAKSEDIYVIEVAAPKPQALKIPAQDGMTLGSGDQNIIQIDGQDLAPIQGKFRIQNGVLSYTDLCADDVVKIGRQKCKKGRMYILDKGDKITSQKLKIIIRKEPLENYEDFEEEYEDEHEEDSEPEVQGLEEELEVEGELEELEELDELQQDELEDIDVLDDDTAPNISPLDQDIHAENTMTEEFPSEQDEEEFEDEDEDDTPNKPGFGAKLKALFSRKKKNDDEEDKSDDEEETPQKKKIAPLPPGLNNKKKELNTKDLKPKKKFREPVTGILPRFLGMFFNIILFGLIYFQALPELETLSGVEISKITKDLHKEITPLIGKIPATIPSIPQSEEALTMIKDTLKNFDVFNIIVIFISYELLFHFLLGVGLGQFLVGLRAKGSFLIVRLLSPLRLALYALLSPLLIFDLPIMLNRRSLKELLTGTRIISKSKKLLFLNSLVTLPLVFILISNIYLFLSMLEQNPPVNRDVTELPKLNVKFNDIKAKINLPSFLINSTAAIKTDSVFLPTLESEGKNTRLTFLATTFRKVENIKVFESRPILPLKHIVTLLKQDPMNLGKLTELEGDEKNNISPVLSHEIDTHILKGIYAAVTFNVNDLLSLVSSVGIVSSPYFKIYKEILTALQIPLADTASLIIGPHNTLLALERVGITQTTYLLDLTEDGLMMTKITYKKSDIGALKPLIQNLWGYGMPVAKRAKSSKKTFVLKSQVEDPEKIESIKLISTPIKAVESLKKVINNNKTTQKDLEMIIKSYTLASQKSITTENNKAQELFLEEFESLDRNLKRAFKRNKDKTSEQLRLDLLRIQKALSDRDESFFQQN